MSTQRHSTKVHEWLTVPPLFISLSYVKGNLWKYKLGHFTCWTICKSINIQDGYKRRLRRYIKTVFPYSTVLHEEKHYCHAYRFNHCSGYLLQKPKLGSSLELLSITLCWKCYAVLEWGFLSLSLLHGYIHIISHKNKFWQLVCETH